MNTPKKVKAEEEKETENAIAREAVVGIENEIESMAETVKATVIVSAIKDAEMTMVVIHVVVKLRKILQNVEVPKVKRDHGLISTSRYS